MSKKRNKILILNDYLLFLLLGIVVEVGFIVSGFVFFRFVFLCIDLFSISCVFGFMISIDMKGIDVFWLIMIKYI